MDPQPVVLAGLASFTGRSSPEVTQLPVIARRALKTGLVRQMSVQRFALRHT